MNYPTNNLVAAATIYRFDEFSFDAADKVLYKSEEIVQLAPKACELLDVLIRNAGKILSKDELMNQIWTDSYVEEANLTHHISALRKALGEDKNGRKFIETIPRKGYRFVAQIDESRSEATKITINERTTTRAIEEIELDSLEKADADENQTDLYDSASTIKLSENVIKKRRVRTIIYTVAALILIGIIVAGGAFGVRLFSAKARKSAILTSAIVPKRIMPDIDAWSPAISPDGKFAAFVMFRNEQGSLWQKNLTTGEMTQLSADVSNLESQKSRLRYSPDGKWLYYIQEGYVDRRIDLYRITATGGNPQRILENIGEIHGEFGFSPDGRQLAFVASTNMNSTLIVADAETGKYRQLARRNDGLKAFGHPWGYTSPGWSPDGKRIVVGGVNESSGQRVYELIEIDAESGAEKLIPISENLRIHQVEWLADGSGMMTVASEATGVPTQIAHVSYPDGKVTVLTNDDFGYDFIRLTKDGRTMIAGKDTGAFNLWTADAKNLSQRKQITIGGGANQGIRSLAFSSDGRIVFSSPQDGSNDLWSVKSDGSDMKQLTKNTGRNNEGHIITPDNRYIVFNSIRGGTNQVWRMDIDGGNAVQLSDTGRQGFGEQLSPDGKWVYYISFPPNSAVQQVYKVSIDGGESAMLTDRNYYRAPRYSPDGKRLIFEGKDENNQPLPTNVIDAATGKTVVSPEKHIYYGFWASDSKHLLSVRGANQELWRYDVETGKDELLANFSPNTIFNFAVTPDGQKYVFSLGNVSAEVILFTDYLSDSK